jgi:hypothetical protein
VLEAAVPVLRHHGAGPLERLQDFLDHLLIDHAAKPDLLRVLARHVHGHVVVKDLDRQVLALRAENLALLLLYDRASPVVRIHHLVADLEQPTPLSMPVVAKTPAGKMAAGEGRKCT